MERVSCFIRKNTKELVRKIEVMGLKATPFYLYCHEYIKVYYNNYGGMFVSSDYPPPSKEYINCGENEELFLALAALNLPTDKHKWFIDYSSFSQRTDHGAIDLVYRVKPYFVKSDIDEYFGDSHDCHLATVEELIEHFKEN